MRTQRASSTLGAGMIAAIGALMLVVAAMGVGGQSPAYALTNCSAGDPNIDSQESAFLTLINDYRSQNGLGSLTLAPSLNRASAWMVHDLGTEAYFSHTDSLGRSPSQRAQDCGYPSGAGENIAAGTVWDTAQEAFDAWKASPGHNANMLNSSYVAIGIGREQVPGSPYNWYWATNFGLVLEGGGGGAPTATNTPFPTNTPQPPPPTNTPQPTNTPPPTNTPQPPPPTNTPSGGGSGPNPTNTPTPTNTPPATNTPSGTPSATSTPTNTPTSTSTPTATPTTPPNSNPTTSPDASVDLDPGANLVTWGGGKTSPAEVIANSNGSVFAIYGYDPVAKRWNRYGPSLPAYSNTLNVLETGFAYWFLASNSVELPMSN